MKITFLGGVEEVTGSRSLVESGDIKILVDCGLFQGERQVTQRNWDPFPLAAASIDAIVLTHAHIDHTGYIPYLVKNGFKGKIYCSKATYELTAILLMDSGSLQEDEARHRNKKADPAHQPVLPLYTKADALNSLKFFQPVDYDAVFFIKSLQVTLIRSGHILGSSFVIVTDGKQTLTFSGDLGRQDQLIQKSPPHLQQTDFLVLESTYGDRLHKEGDILKDLGDIVNGGMKRGGVLVIPCFVVERTQTLLYYLYQLKQKRLIPDIPIYLDSPMAIKVTDLFCKFTDEHKVPASICKDVFNIATYTPTVEESKQLDQLNRPAIIIAGSGMADGGRVMYHLQHYISDAKNTIAFVGFQAPGTKGHLLVEGLKEIRIYGTYYPVKAEIKTIEMLSAHADYNEILDWLSYFKNQPKKIFLNHGELESAGSLKKKIEERFGWSVVIPKYLESFTLD
ncbi:MAG: MBL fold metallo-hydrolase [Candidatus Babeliaceae bacterium]|nr:MBL fold metallo-hydrolase [Candidatus Babeliaceae bacterium]